MTERGEVAGRYRLEGLVGSGGSGQVWAGEDMALQRQVAVKVIQLPLSVDEVERARLRVRVLREARAAARIDSPRSVRVYDVVEEGDQLYVVMELVQSPTLAEVVEREGPLSPGRVAAMGVQLTDALTAAHAAGIVHRDVKPSNVMVLSDESVKLADFGIATVKDDPRITQTGMVLGTPAYMAPEQARGEPAGPPADVWGLGATLYFAVEGRSAFERGNSLATLGAVLHDPPHPTTNAGRLRPILERLLAKRPEDRPTDAEASRLLTSALNGTTSPSAPPLTESFDDTVVTSPPTQTLPARVASYGPSRLLIVVGLLVVLAAAALALAWADDGGGTEGASETSTASTLAPDSSTAPLSTDSTGASTTAPSTTTPPADGGPQTPDGVPGDWVAFTGDVGYTIWHPPGWEPAGGRGNAVDFADPDSNAYLRVDYVTEPGDDPVAAWEQSSRRLDSVYDDYEEISIEPTQYLGFDAALWEYTYLGLRATNLGFVTPDLGFALNFVAPASRWDDFTAIRTAFESGFTPPPEGQGGGGEGDD